MPKQFKAPLSLKLILALTFLTASAPVSLSMSEEDRGEMVKMKSSVWMEMQAKSDKLAAQGKLDEAASILEKMLDERVALGLDLANERSGLARLYEKQKQNQKAEDQLKALLKEREQAAKQTDDFTVAYAARIYAEFLERQGRKNEAAKLKARVAAVEKDSTNTVQDQKLAAEIASSKATNAEKAEKLRKLGADWLEKSDAKKALVYLNKAVQLDPNNAQPVLTRGEAFYSNNDEKSAVKDYQKAISLDGKSAKAYYLMGNLLRGQEKFKEAIAQYDKAIANEPTNIEYLGARAKLLDMAGKQKEALADYSKALEIRPESIWARVQRASTYENMHDYKSAEADYTELIKRYPQDNDFYEYRAKSYLAAGDADKAIADYSKVIELAPRYTGGYAGRAKAFEKKEGKGSKNAAADLAKIKSFSRSAN